MARRERTTALPRHRRRERASSGRMIGGFRVEDRHIRAGILGGAAVLLIGVLAWLAWMVYSDSYLKPRETVVSVGGQKASLSYYADRLLPFFQANTTSSTPLIEQGLLDKIADEFVTIEIAKSRGVDLSEAAVTQAIADELGVPVGGDGSPFDRLYRQRLKTLNMSQGHYVLLVTAQLADGKLRELLKGEVGDSGEAVTLRQVALGAKEQADKVVERIKGGSNMGTIAQEESIDFETKSEDGIRQPTPPEILPAAFKSALAGKADGELIGPVEIEGVFWVFRVETRETAFKYTDAQKNDLIQSRFDALLKQQRALTPAKISFDASDASWAESHLN